MRLPLRRAFDEKPVRHGIAGFDGFGGSIHVEIRRAVEPEQSPARDRSLEPELADAGLEGVLRQVDEQLGEAALGGGVVAQDGREGLVAEGLGKALSEGFAGAGVVAKSVWEGGLAGERKSLGR